MKISSILAGLALSITLIGCSLNQNSIQGDNNIKKETRNTGDYDQISMLGSFDVEIVPGKEGEITVEADENLLPYILTDVKGGNLKIQFESGYSFRTKSGIKITVPVEAIETIKLIGSGNISGTLEEEQTQLSLFLTGSGDIDLRLSSEHLSSSLIGSGDIKLQGKTNHLVTSVSGSGDFEAFELLANFIKATVTGSGDMELYPIETIEAKVMGSGDIEYKGNPKKELAKIIGSGNVREVN